MPIANTPAQVICLIAAASLVIASLYAAVNKKYKLALALLTAGGGFLYAYAALLCNFLNIWDEQYHALVAKNMMDNPFAPMLFTDQILAGHNYTLWTASNIWLHKQPFFLWEIALSFKLFGVSEFTLRLPSVINCTLMIPVCYRTAQLVTKQETTAYLTALCAAGSFFLLKLTSGTLNTDHNDVCFVFLVTASIWAWLEYLHADRQKLHWVIAVGLLSGAAILTKWLTGLLVYLVWGVYLLSEYGFKMRQWKFAHLLLGVGVTILVALPWQIYCLQQFPEVAQQELLFNAKHFTSSIEGHNEPATYFIWALPLQYFGHGIKMFDAKFQWNPYTISCYIILIFGLILFFKSLQKRSARITAAVTLLFVYIFFSIANTKMPAFTFITCIIWFMSIATLLHFILFQIKKLVTRPGLLKALCICGGAVFFYYQTNIGNPFGEYPDYIRQGYTYNNAIFRKWSESTPEGCYIFNVHGSNELHFNNTSYVSAMFYSGRQCYLELPPLETLHELQRQGHQIAIAHNALTPPDYLSDTTLIHLTDSLSFY